MTIIDELVEIEQRALSDLSSVTDLAALGEWKNTVMGKSGSLTKVLRGMGSVPAARQCFTRTA
jgi:phenylalanyl-tRNA synthetase alpha chain